MRELLGRAAPELTLTNPQGQPLPESKSHSLPTLLVFWKSTCVWCGVELPKIASGIARHEGHSKMVRMLGVAVGGDTFETAAQFASEHGLQFQTIVDTDGAIARAFAVERVPSVALVDAQGTVQRVFEGSAEQLSGIVEQTFMSAADGSEPPNYALIGNGCGV